MGNQDQTSPQPWSNHQPPSQPTTTEPKPEPALLHRSLRQQPYKVTSAKGIYLTLDDGRVVMDACGGAAVACLGHGNEEVRDAVMRQMSTGVSYLHSLTYTTDAAEELASFLIDGPPRPPTGAPPSIAAATTGARRFGLERAYFVNSGSEAMDAALKLARQYFFELDQQQQNQPTSNSNSNSNSRNTTRRSKFVARKQSYHGTTIGAMNVGSNLARKIPYSNLQLPDDTVSWVTPAYTYQYSHWRDGETETQFAQRLVAELDAHFQKLDPETVIAFIAEPVVGATSGCTPAPRGYFKGVRRVCDKYGILLIMDEVMCGMGRTGTTFAFEQEHDNDDDDTNNTNTNNNNNNTEVVVPDIVTIGKGLGGGYMPVAGLLVHRKIVYVLKKGTSNFNHGHTYQAHPVGCAATLAVQQILHREGLVDNCAQMGKLLYSLLRDTFANCKYVGDIRGRGLFWGLEFVSDRNTRASFDPSVAFGPRFQGLAFELGVAVYPGTGTVDGLRGDHAILSPPYNVTEDELHKIVQILKRAYDRLEKEVDGKGEETIGTE
ncbi:putative aminotransferase [Exophiala dermatitidis]